MYLGQGQKGVQMKKTVFTLIIASVIGIVVGARVFASAPQSCVVDSTFNRVECCTHMTADGNCAVGQNVTVYNI